MLRYSVAKIMKKKGTQPFMRARTFGGLENTVSEAEEIDDVDVKRIEC